MEEVGKSYVEFCENFQPLLEVNAMHEMLGTNNSKAQAERASNALKQLEDKIDGALLKSQPGSEEHQRLQAMKAYALNGQVDLLIRTQGPSSKNNCHALLTKVISLMEPMANHVWGIYPLVFALAQQSTIMDDGDDLATFLMIDNAYNSFKSNNQADAWNGEKLFEVAAEGQSKSFAWYQKERNLKMTMAGIWKHLFDLYRARNDVPNQLKYGKLSLAWSTAKIKNRDLAFKKDGLKHMILIIDFYFTHNYVKQATHWLALAMFHLMKMRRECHPFQNLLDVQQGHLAHRFAAFGYLIAVASFTHLSLDMVILRPKNDFERLSELMEDGFEVYSKEYPLKLVQTYDEIRPIVKRADSWNKRALKLLDECLEKEDSVRMEGNLQELMTKLGMD